MKNLSSYREPEETIKLNLVRVRLWFNQEDEEIEYYKLPERLVKQLANFVESGEATPEILEELQTALRAFPEWQALTLSEATKEQRASAAGRFILAKGRKVELEYELEVNVTVY